jgi:hypothetical protein
MSSSEPFVIHSAEQVLRFTRADRWDDLPEARKVQLGFNLGVLALALDLSKEDSYLLLTKAREGRIAMKALRHRLLELIKAEGLVLDQDKVLRPF